MIVRPYRLLHRLLWLLSGVLVCLTAPVGSLPAASPLVMPLAAPVGNSATPAQAGVTTMPLIKANLLYNFTRFTDWPAGAFAGRASKLVVCLLGDDAVASALDTLAGKKTHRRRLAVRRVTNSHEAIGCHLLFIGDGEGGNLATLFAALDEAPVLTVAETPDFARNGGIIGLKAHADGRIGFEINLDNANRVGLRLSSKLLNLAEIAPN